MFDRVRKTFFGTVRVSMLLDPAGANTTASAAVVAAGRHLPLGDPAAAASLRAVVLGGTGPVGQRVARLLVRKGVGVTVASRSLSRAEEVCGRITAAVPGSRVEPAHANTTITPGTPFAGVLAEADLIVAAGAAGATLLGAAGRDLAGRARVLIDLNAVPPAGIEGIAATDKARQDGEAFVYGYNTDILGCVVEKASGMPLAEFIRTRITDPLGLKDTRFFVPAAERDRLAAVYSTGKDGTFVRAPEGSKGQGHYVDGPRVSFAGGAGLTSTARDYARFLEMIRQGGTLGGVRILASRSVELMTTNQSGDLHAKSSGPGLGFGLGFQTTELYGANGMAGVGAFGWGGAYGTTYQVDRKSGTVIVLMLQIMPNGTDVQAKFNTLVYQSLLQ